MRLSHCVLIPVFAMILTGCSRVASTSRVPADWQEMEHQGLRQKLAQMRADGSDEVTLSICSVGQLDDRTLLIGGEYRAIDSVRSVLLRSDGAGRTWHDAGFWLTGSAVKDIFVLDAQHAWAVVSWTVESWGPPFAVFRTTDGGKTWQRSTQNLPLIDDQINLPENFGIRFANAADGMVWFERETGDSSWPSSVHRFSYRTRDGGKTWRYEGQSKVYGDFLMPPPSFDTKSEDNTISIRLRGRDEKWHLACKVPADYHLHDDGTAEPR